MFLLILGACYGYEHFKTNKENQFEINKLATIFLGGGVILLIIRIATLYYDRFQKAIYRLSISFDSKLIIILLSMTFLALIGSVIVLSLNKKINKLVLIMFAAITLTHITVNTYIYIGNSTDQSILMHEYKLLADISKDYDNSYYRVKNNLDILTNSSMVMKYYSLDHFTSLTNKNNLKALKRLGYASEWVKLRSKGSNMFIDNILGHKYLLSPERINNSYYELVKSYDGAVLYKLKNDPNFGVLINKNDTIFDKNNSFEVANSLYTNITGDTGLFTIDSIFTLDNVKATSMKDGMTRYEQVDSDYYSYLEKDIIVTDRSHLYLGINHYLDNNQNFRINEAFNLYVNNELVKVDAFTEPDNGTIDLGVFYNKRVNIKLELKKATVLNNITVGLMNVEKYNSFINKYSNTNDVKYKKNKIIIKVNNESEEDKLLLIPITYDSSYKATLNNKNVEVLKLYDNFIGIKVKNGVNNITLSYIPNSFIPTLIVSLVSLIITICLIKLNLYNKLIEINILKNMAYYLYIFIYLAMIVIIYVLLTLCFMVSYFKYLSF